MNKETIEEILADVGLLRDGKVPLNQLNLIIDVIAELNQPKLVVADHPEGKIGEYYIEKNDYFPVVYDDPSSPTGAFIAPGEGGWIDKNAAQKAAKELNKKENTEKYYVKKKTSYSVMLDEPMGMGMKGVSRSSYGTDLTKGAAQKLADKLNKKENDGSGKSYNLRQGWADETPKTSRKSAKELKEIADDMRDGVSVKYKGGVLHLFDSHRGPKGEKFITQIEVPTKKEADALKDYLFPHGMPW